MLAAAIALILAACNNASSEDLLAGKECKAGVCAAGYRCDQRNICVRGSGSSSGGGSGEGGEGQGGAAETPLLPIGAECSDNQACASGHCADNVCCDQACVGECVTCGQLGLFGTCVARTGAGCGTGQVCDSSGSCSQIDGGVCMTVAECSSAPACADGVCCNESCNAKCESCAQLESGNADGLCAPAPEADGECGGLGCVGQGQCCGDALPPTASGCPSECTGGCAGGVCSIACDNANACKADNIVCPPGLDCAVECMGKHACQDAAIDCPPDHACDLLCSNPTGDHACERATVTCTNGPCSVVCSGNEPCKATEVNCGTNACNVSCVDQSADLPTVTCGNACSCEHGSCA